MVLPLWKLYHNFCNSFDVDNTAKDDSTLNTHNNKKGSSLGLSRLFQLICWQNKIECKTEELMYENNKYAHYINMVTIGNETGIVDTSLEIRAKNQNLVIWKYYLFDANYYKANFV